MCLTLDFEVAEVFGGEAGLKALCDRAASKGGGYCHLDGYPLQPAYHVARKNAELGHGPFSIFAVKESGKHPDTGYPEACWTMNLNAPIADKLEQQILGVCERTGLSGFLWDSFSNLGWWQLDYAKGTMRPQYDRMAAMFAKIINAGLRIWPEAMVAFSNYSCVGMVGGNHYGEPWLAGYGYNTTIGIPDEEQKGVLTGKLPLDAALPRLRPPPHPQPALPHVPAGGMGCAGGGGHQRAHRRLPHPPFPDAAAHGAERRPGCAVGEQHGYPAVLQLPSRSPCR